MKLRKASNIHSTVFQQLRLDESLEKEKRESALEQRVQELRKRHGLLPGEHLTYSLFY
jgi:hypothetical protein